MDLKIQKGIATGHDHTLITFSECLFPKPLFIQPICNQNKSECY